MVAISEWYPNPAGPDAEGEWIELLNGGVTVNISGWYLQTGNGKKFFLRGSIEGGEYLLLPRSTTKLTLRNSGETLSLFDVQGNRIDEVRFMGEAPEGKSINRVLGGGGSVFGRLGEPTPGTANKIMETASITQAVHPFGDPINVPLGIPSILTVLLGSSVLITACVLYATKHDEALSYLFFERDE